jgi:hypothetical protein
LIVVFRRHQSFTDEPRIAPGEQIKKIRIKRQCHASGRLSAGSLLRFLVAVSFRDPGIGMPPDY